uniref:centrosome and spindle pole-associated protein 1-like isoform X1 n=1 Tax=Styela clava TaxID=7725 RepID=UPI0019396C2E|nr:centrosome and spindle pole-associated protein 1-like isoform X1 [Styela clava]
MQDEEDLARFIEQQRAKIAHDRDVLKNNPSSAITDNTVNREILNRGKENRVPGGQTNRSDVATTHNPLPIQTAVRPPSTPRIFRLGDDYKKKREKLKEELRADYRNAMADKNIRTTGRRYPDQQTQLPLGGRTNSDLGLSLPIKDRLSAKERLRLERNHEYNEFKHHKEEVEEEKRRARSLSHSPVRNNVPFATPVTKIFAPPNSTIPNKKTIVIPNEPVKDSTNETYEELLERKRKQERSYRGVEDDRDDYRDKYYDDDRDEDGGYHSQRRVRFPSKNRRSQPRGHRSRRDDDFIEDDDDFRYRSRNKRRGRGRRRGRDRSSEEESDDTSEEERLFRRRKNLSLERRKAAPSFEREATTGSLRDNKDKQEFNDLRSKSAPPEQEFTGLQIGKITSANTAQRKKEEYRTDLLRQMEEKKLSKKKQREQDLHFDATVVDASGPIPRSMQTKDQSPPKRHAEVSSPPQDADKKQRKKGKKSLRYKLETSSDDEEDDRPRKGLYRGMPRQPYFAALPPQPPMGYYPSQYPSPYNDAYYYYGTQNPLDPSGIPPPPPPGTGYPGVSPLMAALGPQRGERSNSPERARKSTEVPTARKSFQRNESSLVADDKRDELKKKQQIQEYQDELKIQIAQKEREKKAARQEQERYDLKIEEEARNYNPWGKGGGGAPMKDRQGNLITDLREMHIENEEANRDPTKAEEVVRERLPQTNLYRREDRPVIDLSPRNPGGTEGDDVLSPRFGRSNPFENRQSDEQKQQRDVYKDYLQKQIEEKKKIEAEKKEKERIEEEKEERRLEEQRQKIKAELDAEIEKDRNKKEMARRQNEDLRIQAEERKREEQRKKMEEEDELRIRKERELDERLHRQTNSPPIPTLQAQQPERQVVISPRPQPVEQARISFEDDNLTARHPPPQTQPVVRTPQIRTYRGESPIQQERRPNVQSRAESKRISRELSALRKQLLSEQRRVENQLRTVDLTGPQQPQSRKINTEYLVDLSRAKQKPVSVRRPPTVEKERPSSRALREFTDYKYRPDDTQSIRMFRAEYPETPDDAKALERQQEALIARQGRNLEDLRQQKDGRQPKNRRSEPNRSLIPPSVAQSRASLLEAETTYIPILPDDEEDQDNRYHFNSAQSSPPLSRQSRQPSARDRRRMARKPPSAQSERQVPPRNRPDNYSLSSLATLDVDRLANKNHDRLEKLKAIQGDEVSLTDPDDILDRFVNKQKGGRRRPTTNEDEYGRRAGPSSYNDPLVSHSFNTRPPSVNTVDTEPWLRPETGPTMA